MTGATDAQPHPPPCSLAITTARAMPTCTLAPTDGGICPLDNSIWGETSYPSVVSHECPLSAAHEGIDGQTVNGHVDDYWIDYGNSASDPYIVNGWTEHTAAGCTADFMGTSQSKYGNNDGSTAFFFLPAATRCTITREANRMRGTAATASGSSPNRAATPWSPTSIR